MSTAAQGAFVRVDKLGNPTCRVLPDDIQKYSSDTEAALFEPKDKK